MNIKTILITILILLISNTIIFSKPPKRPSADTEIQILTEKLNLDENQIEVIKQYLLELDVKLEKYEKSDNEDKNEALSPENRKVIHSIIEETNNLIIEELNEEQKKKFEKVLEERKKRHEKHKSKSKKNRNK